MCEHMGVEFVMTPCSVSFCEYTGSCIKSILITKYLDVQYVYTLPGLFTNAGCMMLGEARRTFAGESTDGVNT